MLVISLEKSALTGIHNMVDLLPNGSCAPFVHDISVANYKIE